MACGERRSAALVILMIAVARLDQQRRMSLPFHGLRLIGGHAPGAQRLLERRAQRQHSETSAASAPATDDSRDSVAAHHEAGCAAGRCSAPLDGVGHRHGEQRPLAASLRRRRSSARQIRRAQAGSRGIVHQHPVLGRGAQRKRQQAIAAPNAHARRRPRCSSKRGGRRAAELGAPRHPRAPARGCRRRHARIVEEGLQRQLEHRALIASGAIACAPPKRRPAPAAGITSQ